MFSLDSIPSSSTSKSTWRLLFRKNLVCLLLLLASGAQAQPAVAAADSFTPLFNGKDLSGWVNVNCFPDTWSVKDGVIYCTGKPTGALRTTRQYENFVLEMEWRHLKPGGNAGIFLWSGAISSPGVPFLRAIEVQVLDHGYGQSDSHTTHGDVFPIHGSTMKPFGRSRGMRSFPSEERSKGSPEWNHYRIVCTNGTLRLHVNGKEVSGGSDCNYRQGYIALESEGSPVEFRNIRIQELPSTGAPAEATAPVEEGWTPLYTGPSFPGWKTLPQSEKSWQSEDWRIALKGSFGNSNARRWHEIERTDVEFIVDFQLPKNSNPELEWLGVCLRGVDKPAVTIGKSTAPIAFSGPAIAGGQWHRLHIQLRGRSLRAQLDSKPAVNGLLPANAPDRGSIGLAGYGRELEIASLYARPL